MGAFHYGSPAATFELDDRVLAHLELVMMAKLRRQESFSFALAEDDGSRRQAMWISPLVALRFSYVAPMPEINKKWLQDLVDTANSPGGLRVVPEPSLD